MGESHHGGARRASSEQMRSGTVLTVYCIQYQFLTFGGMC